MNEFTHSCQKNSVLQYLLKRIWVVIYCQRKRRNRLQTFESGHKVQFRDVQSNFDEVFVSLPCSFISLVRIFSEQINLLEDLNFNFELDRFYYVLDQTVQITVRRPTFTYRLSSQLGHLISRRFKLSPDSQPPLLSHLSFVSRPNFHTFPTNLPFICWSAKNGQQIIGTPSSLLIEPHHTALVFFP